MPDLSELQAVAAEYRIRLFLSVDLSGSTAFKNSTAGEDRQQGAVPKWVTVFQTFYRDFPARFSTEFQKQKTESVGNDGSPKLWKAVGDELVFCGRISNQKACIVALNSFIATMHNYRNLLSQDGIDLNVKGAGWLAAFPEPNRTVQLSPRKSQTELLPASEALELSADQDPFDFDFLGKAIDTGFRVAANAKPEKFYLSVQLAQLLTGAKPEFGFGHQIRMDRPTTLKGVNKNEPYPVLYIDTMEHLPNKDARLLERELMAENQPPDQQRLFDYLKAYCSVVGTDEVMLKEDAGADDVDAPESYNQHKDKIAEHLLSEKDREFGGGGNEDHEDAQDQVDIEEPDLEPLAEEAHESEDGKTI